MDKKTLLGAKENGMNRLYSMMFLIAGAVAMPAMADGHGDHRKGGERMKNAVKQMDANNDGAISFEEFRMPEGRDAPEMRMDANGDGEITRDEVSQAATQRTEEALTHFDALDADGDGVVTQSERRRAAFDRMDGDGDGQITKSEFREARKDRRRMMQERGGHRGHGEGERKGMDKGQSGSN
jgi:Ca2+-binding EF-hand superfamily protein